MCVYVVLVSSTLGLSIGTKLFSYALGLFPVRSDFLFVYLFFLELLLCLIF